VARERIDLVVFQDEAEGVFPDSQRVVDDLLQATDRGDSRLRDTDCTRNKLQSVRVWRFVGVFFFNDFDNNLALLAFFGFDWFCLFLCHRR
jgi:hypothetical protein